MNPLDAVRSLLEKLFGGQSNQVQAQKPNNSPLPSWTRYANPEEVKKQFGRYPDDYQAKPQASTMPQMSPPPQVQQNVPVSNDALAEKIRKGLRGQLGRETPAEQYIPQFVEAAQKYDFFRQNPYLLPQIAILETSGGLNITRPNNIVNWGINFPGNNEAFAQMTPQEVLGRAISGLGERDPNYTDIRKNNDLQKFAQTYEPANPSYYGNLMKGIQYFQNQ